MKYILRNKDTGLFFKGYAGQGKSLGNKPTWTKKKDEAVEYPSKIGLRMRLRLECQSQIVDLVPIYNMSIRKQL